MNSLQRFVVAQSGGVYETALGELQAGTKRTHWMWFVFPQLAGLGRSETARFYALADRAEAAAFRAHRLLGPRLTACTDAMLSWAGRRDARAILGALDALKFRSSMTLFEAAAANPRPFAGALEAFYGGERDAATLALLD